MSSTLTDTRTEASSRTLLGGSFGGALRSRDTVLVAVLLMALVFASVSVDRFASTVTVGYLLLDAIPLLLLALPMTLIIVTGEIDLSVASIVGLTTATVGTLWLNGYGFLVTAIAALVVGILAGVTNGFLIAYVGLPSLAVTIGTLALYRGLALVVIGDNAVGDFPPDLSAFVTSKIGGTGIPVVMVGVLVIAAIFATLLHFTPFGRGLYALGFSKEAATFVGFKGARAKFWLYVASGLVCGIVGLYWSLRYSSARSDSAAGLELTVIAAVLLGGVSIFGGRGTITGALTGVLLIAVINYALRLQRVPQEILIVITGSLLIISVVGPSIYERLRAAIHTRSVNKRVPAAVPAGGSDA